MPNQAATATIIAGSQVAASVALDVAVRSSPTGNSSVGAAVTAAWHPQASIATNSTFTVWVVLASGTLAGAGNISASADRDLEASGSFTGAGGISGSVVQTVILGAQAVGAGTLSDGLFLSAAGVLAGAGAISATPIQTLAARSGFALVGRGTLGDNLPLPMVGAGFLVASYDVVQVPQARCPPVPVPTFRYGYTLGRGDLELLVTDTSGEPNAPVMVLFAFYQVVAGGQRVLVGPPNRRPAMDTLGGLVGRYYATGTAGELGQPGDWVCVWRYQRSWWTPVETVELPFKVVDEVASGDPDALTGRCIKYGWL